MYKLIAVIGESGSGKDYFVRTIVSEIPNIRRVINCTTRPMRQNEINDVDYHFITPQEYGERLVSMRLIEATSFNDWFYGTDVEDLSSNVVNIGVFNPASIDILEENPKIDLKVIYVKTNDRTRLQRQLNRDKNVNVNEIIRRFQADQQDFSFLPDNVIILPNESFTDLSASVATINDIIRDWTKEEN